MVNNTGLWRNSSLVTSNNIWSPTTNSFTGDTYYLPLILASCEGFLRWSSVYGSPMMNSSIGDSYLQVNGISHVIIIWPMPPPPGRVAAWPSWCHSTGVCNRWPARSVSVALATVPLLCFQYKVLFYFFIYLHRHLNFNRIALRNVYVHTAMHV